MLPERSTLAISISSLDVLFFFQAEDGIRYYKVTGVQTCALPISTQSTWLPPTAPLAHWSMSADWLAARAAGGRIATRPRVGPTRVRSATRVETLAARFISRCSFRRGGDSSAATMWFERPDWRVCGDRSVDRLSGRSVPAPQKPDNWQEKARRLQGDA